MDRNFFTKSYGQEMKEGNKGGKNQRCKKTDV